VDNRIQQVNNTENNNNIGCVEVDVITNNFFRKKIIENGKL